MSIEEDAESRLAAALNKHVMAGNVVPFKPRSARSSPLPKPAQTASASGKGVAAVVGNNNHVNISIHAPPPRPAKQAALPVDPGGAHISDSEAVELKDLVDKVAAASSISKQQVWSTLNRQVRVTTYRRIPRSAFGECVTYMRRWLGRLGANGSGTVDDLRKAIMAELDKRGLRDSRATLIEPRYGVTSLTKITKAQMDDFLRYVRTLPL